MSAVESILILCVLLLGLAVVALFAMLGELNSRLENIATVPLDDDRKVVVPDADLRDIPEQDWPEPLRHLIRLADWRVIVLSTSCSMCRDVADSFGEPASQDSTTYDVRAIVISCPDLERGRKFADDHGLSRTSTPLFIDAMGSWLTGAFNIRVSPALLTLEGSKLTRAETFTSSLAIPLQPA